MSPLWAGLLTVCPIDRAARSLFTGRPPAALLLSLSSPFICIAPSMALRGRLLFRNSEEITH